jgi:hypothetical protein
MLVFGVDVEGEMGGSKKKIRVQRWVFTVGVMIFIESVCYDAVWRESVRPGPSLTQTLPSELCTADNWKNTTIIRENHICMWETFRLQVRPLHTGTIVPNLDARCSNEILQRSQTTIFHRVETITAAQRVLRRP